MARRSIGGPSNPEPPVLLISRDDARTRLNKLIEGAKQLSVEADYERWRRLGHELLTRIFSTGKYAQDYDFDGFAVVLDEHGSGWLARAKAQTMSLQSIIDRLDLIPVHEHSTPTSNPQSDDAFWEAWRRGDAM